uniref:Corticotropin releasing hormone receptor 1 n=1 Tax=Bos mutus grunniens TaxID=30521 RepID=A0A8B9YAC9_BOSMU
MGRCPQLRLVKALLLLGLNSISASLQDQHCESLSVASNVSEEEQGALPHRCHHQLPRPLHLPGGPPGGLCPLSAAQEHPVPEKHHPLEPHLSLHPAQCHVVRGPAHHEPRSPSEQRGLVQAGDSRLQLLPRDQLLLDVRRGLLPAHGHRAHVLHRPAAQVDVYLHRLGCAFPHHCGLGHWEAVLRQ